MRGLCALLANDTNLRHGPATNQALSWLAGRPGRLAQWVWVLDSDCVVARPDVLSKALSTIEGGDPALVGEPGWDRWHHCQTLGLYSLLLRPARVWLPALKPFATGGNPIHDLLASAAAARLAKASFRFTADGYGIHRGRGSLAAVVERNERSNPLYEWAARAMAARHGIGKDTVARIWRDHNLRPWRTDRFKVSNDPRFEEKLIDVVGLYLNPPERAVVFSFDEKTQVQALDRTQPSLPMRPGRAGTMTHDYKRNGTTDLFAALNVGTGEILTDCRKHHKGADVLRFFKLIDLHVPRGLEVHVVLDNLSAHKAPEVKKWLADPKRARWHLHFIPTSSSWLNLVERWFKELTDRRLRRGMFNSVAAFIDAIETWVEHWNDDPKPFIWHKPAEEIVSKVRRGRAALAEVKSATQD
jgi:transposase